MNVNYVVTYDSVTRLILKCEPAGGTYPDEGATGVENQAILHQTLEPCFLFRTTFYKGILINLVIQSEVLR